MINSDRFLYLHDYISARNSNTQLRGFSRHNFSCKRRPLGGVARQASAVPPGKEFSTAMIRGSPTHPELRLVVCQTQLVLEAVRSVASLARMLQASDTNATAQVKPGTASIITTILFWKTITLSRPFSKVLSPEISKKRRVMVTSVF